MHWALLWASALIGAGVGIFVAVDTFLDGSPSGRRAVCDRYAQTLFQSTDPVEIARAGIIIREMPCSLRRRLPPTN